MDTVPILWETREDSEKAHLKHGGVGCEIGVFKGKHATFLTSLRPKKLYLVDPWSQRSLDDREWRDRMYQAICDKFKTSKGTEIVRARSVDAAQWFPDESFDWVVVDGDHTRQGVLDDFSEYYPKLKKGGILSCHDYNRDKASLNRGFDVPAYLHEAIDMYPDLVIVGQSSERIGRNLIVRKEK